MSTKDTLTKKYMQDPKVFADSFNYLLYDGRQIIQANSLIPLDSTVIALPHGKGGKPFAVQRFRDVLKKAAVMTDNKTTYLILGIENQSELHYAIPVRNMLYDAISYAAQVEEIAKKHRKGKDKAPSNGEFLSGFYKTDRVHPVVTLVIYFGPDKWDAPLDLYEMMKPDEQLLPFVNNFKTNLIVPAEIDDAAFDKFHTELRNVLEYIKYSKDKVMLKEIVNANPTYKSIDKTTADLVNIMTGSKLKFPKRKEKIDMCEAIKGMREDARNEGLEEGLEKGMEKGMEKGRNLTIYELVESGDLTLDRAAEKLSTTAKAVRKEMRRHGYKVP